MIIEKNDNLVLVKRLCDWLDEKGMTAEYFFEMLKEVGFVFPLRINNFTENKEKNSFSFLCSSADTATDPVSYQIILNADEDSPRMINFENIHGFWEQPMII